MVLEVLSYEKLSYPMVLEVLSYRKNKLSYGFGGIILWFWRCYPVKIKLSYGFGGDILWFWRCYPMKN